MLFYVSSKKRRRLISKKLLNAFSCDGWREINIAKGK